MGKKEWAQDFPYWGTTVAASKSRASLDDELDKFGARVIIIATGRMENKISWRISFEYNDKPYLLTFNPLPVYNSTEAKEEQAIKQMGRLAFYTVKNLCMAAELLPASLFGFLALTDACGKTTTAAELGVDNIIGQLPGAEFAKPAIALEPSQEIPNG